jgi:hypothetical protein
MEFPLKTPLTNAQLELLKAFSHDLNESELAELRRVLAQFFAKRAIQQANKVWEEKGWTDADVDKLLQTKMRSSRP